MSERGIDTIWPDRPPSIGMVHLLPLPGSPSWSGSMAAVLDRAIADAHTLAAAGFDGLIVENYADVPFFAETVGAETVAAMTAAALAVAEATELPLGINVLRNDAAAALGVAVAVGARFVRVNVHTGVMFTDQGVIEGRAASTLRLRRALDAEVAILADVHVKHATPPCGLDLEAASADAWHRGRADALIVSGVGTGAPTELGHVDRARAAVPAAPVLIGSGVRPENVAHALMHADGAVIGSAVMVGGLAGAGVDADRARAMVEGARG